MASLVSEITNRQTVYVNNSKTCNNHVNLLNEKITDTVDISEENKSKEEKKKKTSKAVKISSFIFGGMLGVVGALSLISRRQIGLFNRLYKDKIVLTNFKETLVFRAANTLEEGIKFTKEVLGIKAVDENFTVEALNYVNEGLVNVINANNGKCFMPKGLYFTKIEDDSIACVVNDVTSKYFGCLNINSRFFDREVLISRLREHPHFKTSSFAQNSSGVRQENHVFVMKDDFSNLSSEFKNNEDLPIQSLHKLFFGIHEIYNSAGSNAVLVRAIKTRAKEKGLSLNFDDLKNKDYDELCKIFVQNFANENVVIEPNIFSSIYHEMGHLQDWALNLNNVHLEEIKNKFSIFRRIKNSKLSPLDNRWSGIMYDGLGELLEKSPKEFQKKYPDLYKFLTDKDIQFTAEEVSPYATGGIGEFIAEVYAKMVANQPLSDEVMALYKKYNGPMLPE